jgi:hypothetical protein
MTRLLLLVTRGGGSVFNPPAPSSPTPDKASLVLTRYAPNVSATGSPLVPGTRSLVITRYAPAVTASTGGAFYMSPTGNNSTGNGTIGNPWRTFTPFLDVCEPGDTLLVRGGSYSGSDMGNWEIDRSGTSSAPITIAAYPGETPVINGYSTRYCFNFIGASYVVLEGLTLVGWDQADTGAITSTSSAHHLTLRDMNVALASGGTSNQHTVYMGPGVHHLTVEDCVLDGNGGSGCGISVYSSSGAPHPYSLTLTGGTIKGFNATGTAHGRGVNINTTSSTGPYTVNDVHFEDNRYNVRAEAGLNISVTNCDGDAGYEASLSRVIANTPGWVATGNVFA